MRERQTDRHRHRGKDGNGRVKERLQENESREEGENTS